MSSAFIMHRLAHSKTFWFNAGLALAVAWLSVGLVAVVARTDKVTVSTLATVYALQEAETSEQVSVRPVSLLRKESAAEKTIWLGLVSEITVICHAQKANIDTVDRLFEAKTAKILFSEDRFRYVIADVAWRRDACSKITAHPAEYSNVYGVFDVSEAEALRVRTKRVHLVNRTYDLGPASDLESIPAEEQTSTTSPRPDEPLVVPNSVPVATTVKGKSPQATGSIMATDRFTPTARTSVDARRFDGTEIQLISVGRFRPSPPVAWTRSSPSTYWEPIGASMGVDPLSGFAPFRK
jgi:hypothetical protein